MRQKYDAAFAIVLHQMADGTGNPYDISLIQMRCTDSGNTIPQQAVWYFATSKEFETM